ncbi:MAG TPA: rhomboid family intramembrane serine protease [Xanthobacteraceae bacterium]|nr:rhomboid family intramembrane serine protease [Xanthobacteraceae bacterium]
MFPFTDTAPRAARPILVIGLIAINTLVFLWMQSLPPRMLERVLLHAALIPARYSSPMEAINLGLDPDSWWPLITSAFMHGGWIHLIINMWFLWIFGPAMEARFGRFGFLVLYLGGAVAASFVHLWAHPWSPDPVLGASGAVAAIIAAHAVSYPRARVITIVLLGFIPLFFPLPAILFALIWFGLQLIQGSSELMAPHLASEVAWWAHIGGFAFGALFALIIRTLMPHPKAQTTVWSEPPRRHIPVVRPRNWPE